MDKLLLFFLLLLVSVFQIAHAQDTTYTHVSYEVWGQEGRNVRKSWYFGSVEGYVALNVFRYLNTKLAYENENAQSAAKLKILQTTYNEAENIPTTIVDGWHNAIATDNVSYYKIVKALVKDNRVAKIVVDNYLPIPFVAANEIKKAKIALTLENHNNENVEIVDLYFLYDLDAPVIVDEPEHPGYVCFRTNRSDFNEIVLLIDGKKYGRPFKTDLQNDVDCFSQGTVCFILKPGFYRFEALFRGSGELVSTLLIKPDYCLHYNIGNKKDKKKSKK